MEEGCFCQCCAHLHCQDYVPAASVWFISKAMVLYFICPLRAHSLNRSTHPACVALMLYFFFPLSFTSHPPSLIRPGPVLRFCQEHAGRFRRTGE